jgi:S-DNA-T family DNA segregation ATPase FtsK/SpoIIIE
MPGEFIAKFYSKTLKYRAIELSSAEIKKIYAQYGEPETCVDVIREIEISASQKAEDIDECLNDEILPKAIQIVIEAQSASTTLIQRRLKIGYSRAARIIDVLEQCGIIGPYEGAKPRKVLISRQQWYEMNALANSELYP